MRKTTIAYPFRSWRRRLSLALCASGAALALAACGSGSAKEDSATRDAEDRYVKSISCAALALHLGAHYEEEAKSTTLSRDDKARAKVQHAGFERAFQTFRERAKNGRPDTVVINSSPMLADPVSAIDQERLRLLTETTYVRGVVDPTRELNRFAECAPLLPADQRPPPQPL